MASKGHRRGPKRNPDPVFEYIEPREKAHDDEPGVGKDRKRSYSTLEDKELVVCGGYCIERPEEPIQEYEGEPERDTPFIKVIEGAGFSVVGTDEIGSDIVVDAANLLKPRSEFIHLQTSKKTEDNRRSYIFEERIEDEFGGILLPFVRIYGLPMNRFRHVVSVSLSGDNKHLIANFFNGHQEELIKAFGYYLHNVDMNDPRLGNIDLKYLLFEWYREPVFEVFRELFNFSTWTRKFIKDGAHTPSLWGEATTIINRSRSWCEWEKPTNRFVITRSATSLIDLLYLRVIEAHASDKPFRICKNSNCQNVFLPRSLGQYYCKPQCANYTTVNRWREQNLYGDGARAHHN